MVDQLINSQLVVGQVSNMTITIAALIANQPFASTENAFVFIVMRTVFSFYAVS